MAKFEELAVRYMADLMRDFRLLDFQAAGIVGNGGAESSGFTQVQELNPTVKGSAGGLGHFQWTGRTATNGRRLAFERWLAQNADKGWTPSTYEANYSMLFRELKGPESAALAALRNTTTLADATIVFCRKFERAGIEHMDSRIRWAQRALDAYRKAPKGAPEKPPVKDTGKGNPPIAGGEVAAGGAVATGGAVIVGKASESHWGWLEWSIAIVVLVALIGAAVYGWHWWKARKARAAAIDTAGKQAVTESPTPPTQGTSPWISTGDQSQEPSHPSPQNSAPSLVQLSAARLALSSAASPEVPLPQHSARKPRRKPSAKPSPKTRRRPTSSPASKRSGVKKSSLKRKRK